MNTEILDEVVRQVERDQPDRLPEILGALGEKNTVRVSVRRGGHVDLLAAEHEVVQGLQAPMLIQADRLRVSNGLKPMYTPALLETKGVELAGFSKNLRVNVGIDYCAVQLGGSASATTAKYVAVSNNTNAAAAANTATNTTNTRICWGTDTATDAAASTSRGEYSALGFARALATYAHTTSATSFTQTVTFTATSAATNMQCCGIFDNATKQSGTLFCENTYTATTFANTDALTITWTMNI